jgi:hypothetical protein
MDNNAICIKDILNNNSYIIPRYQRNYAWGKKEISQLIRDIDEFFNEDNPNQAYYLGSLVCFKRDDGFELIDGQQRHTTLTLINLVLKYWNENINGTISKPNLKFDSRHKVQQYIEKLYNSDNFNKLKEELNNDATGNFKVAIEIIQGELRKIEDVNKFSENFYNHVFLFQIEVPEDTNLNHYFEIMNSRGEQLEKHEIVKSHLMGKIEDENKEKDQKIFAEIWDACSDMTNYVYFNFNASNRKKLFDKGHLKCNSFTEIDIEINDNENKEWSLSKILECHQIEHNSQNNDDEIKEKYKSIIDFPNFLLQVLALKHDKVSLDDKKLLDHFREKNPEPKEFIYDLLKYRTLFDMYIIKQNLSDTDENKQNWGLRKLEIKQGEKTPKDEYSLIRTFDNDGDNTDSEELVKLQVMLYYSNSTNTYNNWLYKILQEKYFEGDLNDYTQNVFQIAKEWFDKDHMQYPDISIFNLYFIDFLLWKLYKEQVRNLDKIPDDAKMKTLKEKIFRQRDLFNFFRFKQVNSREHLYSQELARMYKIKPEVYHGIGNLCLISTTQNSEGNKLNPTDKKQKFKDKKSSLKLRIMFESFEDDKWEPEQIKKHEEEIMELINASI